MATADDNNAALANNGIFRSEKNNELHCLICTNDTAVVDWKKHVENPRHVGSLERFNLTFERRDAGLGCGECKADLSWSKLKEHAAQHSIVPWHQPPDRYKKFFENQFLEWDSQFYCYPCDIIFPEWSTAFSHIIDRNHQSLLTAEPQVETFETVETLYELLISEGLVSASIITTKCRICDCSDIGLRDIFSHTRGPQHSEKKWKFVADLKERYLSKSLVKKASKTRHKEESTDVEKAANSELQLVESLPTDSTPDDKNSSSATLHANGKVANGAKIAGESLQNTLLLPDSDMPASPLFYLTLNRLNSCDFFCNICKMTLIGEKSVNYHIETERHKLALKENGCDEISLKKFAYSNVYYCECCDLAFPDRESVHLHVVDVQHTSALLNKQKMRTIVESPDKSQAPKPTESASCSSRQSLSCNYIAKISEVDFFCRICEVILSSPALVDYHIAGKLHDTAVKRFGCDSFISLVFNKEFYCRCCDVIIPTLDHIFPHTESDKHRTCENDPVKQVNEEYTKQLEIPCQSEAPPQSAVPRQPEAPRQPAVPRQPEAPRQPAVPPQPEAPRKPDALSYFMQKINDADLHCKICNLVLFGQTAVNDHIVSEHHVSTFKRYGCAHISLNNDNTFYCKICRCRICQPEKIIMHMRGFPHQTKLAELEGRNFPVEPEPRPLPQNGARPNFPNASIRYSLPDLRGNLNNGVQNSMGEKSIASALLKYGADAYISHKSGNKYWCECCNCEVPSRENIYGHTTSGRHKHAVKNCPQKKLTAQPATSSPRSPCCYVVHVQNEDFHCKICDLVLSGQESVNEHAAGEQHAAALKRYGCDYIIPGQGIDYHCKSCSCKVPGLSNVFLHIRGTRHRDSSSKLRNNTTPESAGTRQQLLQNASMTTVLDDVPKNDHRAPPCLQTAVEDSPAPKPQATGSNHFGGDKFITFKGGDKYQCTGCKCEIPSFENILVHISGNKHKAFLTGSTNQPIAPFHSSHCFYIVRMNDADFHCQVCNLRLSGEANIKDHATGEQHAASLVRCGCNKITPNGDNTYYCKICKCKIPSLANVYLHIKGYKHKDFLPATISVPMKLEATKPNASSMEKETSNESANGTKQACPFAPLDFIVELNDTTFICKVCNLLLTDKVTARDHLAKKQHADARDKNGCDDISPGENGKYHCRCCDCEIPNLENLYRHIKGQRHSKNVSIKGETPTEKNKTSEAAVVSSLPTGISTLPESMDPTPCSSSMAIAVELQSQLKSHLAKTKVNPSKAENTVNETMKDCAGNIKPRADDSPESINATNLNAKSTSDSRSFNANTVNHIADRSNMTSPVSSVQSSASKTTRAGRKPRASTNTNVAKLAGPYDFDERAFDPDNDYIHDMTGKRKYLEVCMELVAPIEVGLRCLVCHENLETLDKQEYIRHFGNLEHYQNFAKMKANHALFENALGQYSDYDLALELMEENSDDKIYCFACNKNIDDDDYTVETHIAHKVHAARQRHFSLVVQGIELEAQCDWYKIYKYQCKPCAANFQSEFSFTKHLKCAKHANVLKKLQADERLFFYDCCELCSVLWYEVAGQSFPSHVHDPTHLLIAGDELCFAPDLPPSAKLLLKSAEKHTEAMIRYYDKVSDQERQKEKDLTGDVQEVLIDRFPNQQINLSLSKAYYLSISDSDIDLFIDSCSMYERKESVKDGIMAFVNGVHQCLRKDSQSWEKVSLERNSQAKVPTLRAQHIATGLTCNVYFGKSLCMESAINIAAEQAQCRLFQKMMLFLEQWLTFCELSGAEGISSYALRWCVIFFLQKESIIRSIAANIEAHKTSSRVLGTSKQAGPDFELVLARFFAFYAEFDYRYDVACPLLGQVVKKRAFLEPQNLPKEMIAYVTNMKSSDNPEPLRIDSAMCVQDPFDLRRNLTQDVSKAYMSRFRIFCKKSADSFRSSQIGSE